MSFLTILGLITTVLAITAGIIGTVSDIREEKTKKIKTIGYVYIALFILFSVSNFIVDKLKDAETEMTNQNSFKAIVDSTKLLLQNTGTNLKKNLDSLALTEKSIKSLTEQTAQNLNGVVDKSEKNLRTISKVLDDLNTVATPLVPVEFIVRLKCKLDRPLLPQNGWDSVQSRQDHDNFEKKIQNQSFGVWEYMYNYMNESYWAKVNNWDGFQASIIPKFFIYLTVFEYYPNRGGGERIRYDVGGKKSTGVELLNELYFNKKDTTLIIPIKLKGDKILVRALRNMPTVKSFNELLHNTGFLFQVTEFLQLNSSFTLITEKDSIYSNEFIIKSVTFSPYLKINYGKDLLQTIEYTSPSIFTIGKYALKSQNEFSMNVDIQ